jgi:hypothetical protein
MDGMNNAGTGLLTLGAMARKLGVTSKWLRTEADAGNLPNIKADERYLFEPKTVVSILVERARAETNRAS